MFYNKITGITTRNEADSCFPKQYLYDFGWLLPECHLKIGILIKAVFV